MKIVIDAESFAACHAAKGDAPSAKIHQNLAAAVLAFQIRSLLDFHEDIPWRINFSSIAYPLLRTATVEGTYVICGRP